MALFGCDTLVVLPPLTGSDAIIFGKNSDRPSGEVQEILYVPSKTFGRNEKVQCTFIEIDQFPSTYSVLLSKPSWMWGAEMGSNSCGVVIGNEAVWTVVDDDSQTERLLGMDLLRLGLERSSNAKEAVTIVTSLLEKFGQGGPCSDTDLNLLYHNSFLIADKTEVWILETAGQLWAAEQVTSGHRNISNCLSIGTNITLMSEGLKSYAKEQKLWKGESEFSFKDVFSSREGCYREVAGRKLLEELTADKQFNAERMFKILRDKESSICMPASGSYHTSGSWVSVLRTKNDFPSCHWLTGTPDPSLSLFKPFIFSPNPNISSHMTSSSLSKDPAKMKPRFQFEVDRRHNLYKLHGGYVKSNSALKNSKDLEEKFLKNTDNLMKKIECGLIDISACDDLLKDSVEEELKFYSQV